jgi:hypothetical protein
MFPGLDVTMYPVIALPPLDAGGVKATFISPIPAVTAPIIGLPGIVAGVTALEAADAGLVRPAPFVAFTVNV